MDPKIILLGFIYSLILVLITKVLITGYLITNEFPLRLLAESYGLSLSDVEIFAIVLVILVWPIYFLVSNIRFKIALGFVYSLITSYFIIYKFALRNLYYYVGIIMGDDGFWSIILAWPIYLVVSIPLLIVFLISFFKSPRASKPYLVLMLLPTICGILLLGFVTFTGRMLYQPIYKYKIAQLQTKVLVNPKQIQYDGYVYDPECECTRPIIRGTVEISNKLDSQIRLKISSPGGWICKIIDFELLPSQEWQAYVLKKGKQTKMFRCEFTEPLTNFNLNAVRYILQFQQQPGVKTEKIYSVNNFSEVVNFK